MLSTNISVKKSCSSETLKSRHQAVEQVILRMQEQLDENLSLKAMADIAMLSPYHFNRIFRQITGIPPSQFLYALRIEKAKKLLLTTELNVTDICYEVGYSSLGSFVTRFTDLVGLPPSQFRRLPHQIANHSENIHKINHTNQRIVHSRSSGLIGKITTPTKFNGLFFVGLFSSSIPQKKPINCTVLTRSGTYHLPCTLKNGSYRVFAAAFTQGHNTIDHLLQAPSLRGATEVISVKNGRVSGNRNITLNSAQLIDPPLLISIPFLLFNRHVKHNNFDGLRVVQRHRDKIICHN